MVAWVVVWSPDVVSVKGPISCYRNKLILSYNLRCFELIRLAVRRTQSLYLEDKSLGISVAESEIGNDTLDSSIGRRWELRISPGKGDWSLYMMFVVIQLPRSVNGIKRCSIYKS